MREVVGGSSGQQAAAGDDFTNVAQFVDFLLKLTVHGSVDEQTSRLLQVTQRADGRPRLLCLNMQGW